MNLKKYLVLGGVLLSMGLQSCVNDLDLEPIDPQKTYVDPNSPEDMGNAFAQCYTNLGYCGTKGPGESNITTNDAGMTVYIRLLFAINEMGADEAFWVWKDYGINEIVTNTQSAGNLQIQYAYARIYQHVAVCNTFLALAEESSVPGIERMIDEVRALRAYSFYNICDIWGNSPFPLEANGEKSPQKPRKEIYQWLETELTDLVDNGNLAETPAYGRVGKDGVEALLARLYANAEVYCDGPVAGSWANCLRRCNNVIERQKAKNKGLHGTGLATHYLNLFAANNSQYMPGESNTDGNEILWGVPFDLDHGQSYGNATFLTSASLAAGGFGFTTSWSCMAARKDLSMRFMDEPQDVRWSLWITDGRTPDNEEFLKFDNAGYQAIKYTNWIGKPDGTLDTAVDAREFGASDTPLIRLADLYLMRAECYLHGQGDRTAALEGVNYLRERAGVTPWTGSQLTADNLLDERSRELYFELTRRTDLIRFGKFAGANQATWAWKGNARDGSTIQEWRKLMPIPTNILAAQPELVQNKGY